MATVTAYTAARMKEILDQTIKFLSIDASGNLVATREDDSQENLGNVKGPPGNSGQMGPPGTTPAVLKHVSQAAGGNLAPGETSVQMTLTGADLLANHWYGVQHVADISTSVDGAHALFIVLNGQRLQCIYEKAIGDPTATRGVIGPMHIWLQASIMNDAVFGITNSSGSAGTIVYNNAVGFPRTFTLLDLGPGPTA